MQLLLLKSCHSCIDGTTMMKLNAINWDEGLGENASCGNVSPICLINSFGSRLSLDLRPSLGTSRTDDRTCMVLN